MVKKNVTVRNKEIARGINRLGRSAGRTLRGVHLIKKKAKPAPKAKVVAPTPSKWYTADDVKKPLPNRKRSSIAKLKPGLTAGTVIIILSGRFRGKRAVFLKQLASGLLLVTGPFKVNGIPLRRVNQAYTIATSTSIDVSKVDTSKVDDAFFARVTTNKQVGDFFKATSEKTAISAGRKAAQKTVDTAILASVKSTPLLRQYLNAKFSLKRGQAPHRMQF